MSEYNVACRPCTDNNKGTPVLTIETERNLVDRNDCQQAGITFPAGIAGKILLVRLLCPRCSKQSLFFPVIEHYECESCGHKKVEYIRGMAQVNKGMGVSYKESFQGDAQNKAMLEEMRRGSIGGYGS